MAFVTNMRYEYTIYWTKLFSLWRFGWTAFVFTLFPFWFCPCDHCTGSDVRCNFSILPRYGFRGTSARCELALILECVQSVVGVIIQVKNQLSLSLKVTIFGAGLYGRHCLCQARQAKEQVFKVIIKIIAFLLHVFLRTNTVMFSKKAVICQRNGSLYLQFRCHHSTRESW